MEKKYPCYECKERTPSCHASCEGYQEALARDQELKRKEKLRAAAGQMMSAAQVAKINRFSKSTKRNIKLPGIDRGR